MVLFIYLNVIGMALGIGKNVLCNYVGLDVSSTRNRNLLTLSNPICFERLHTCVCVYIYI